MPQTFQVLKCYKCLVFQIHQTKKSNKFECKMCGEKQSIKRHYGIGTGKDCRLHVQRLNSLRGDMEANANLLSESDEEVYKIIKEEHKHIEVSNNPKAPKQSKWSTFVDDKKENDKNATEEPMFLRDQEVLLELPQNKNKKKFTVAKATNEMKELTGITNITMNNPDISMVSEIKVVETIDTARHEFKNNYKPIQHSSDVEYTEQKSTDISETVKKMPKNQDNMSINKNSKWAQFVDTEEGNEYIDNDELNENSSKSRKLFSLCDDNDLDNVLDI